MNKIQFSTNKKKKISHHPLTPPGLVQFQKFLFQGSRTGWQK